MSRGPPVCSFRAGGRAGGEFIFAPEDGLAPPPLSVDVNVKVLFHPAQTLNTDVKRELLYVQKIKQSLPSWMITNGQQNERTTATTGIMGNLCVVTRLPSAGHIKELNLREDLKYPSSSYGIPLIQTGLVVCQQDSQRHIFIIFTSHVLLTTANNVS